MSFAVSPDGDSIAVSLSASGWCEAPRSGLGEQAMNITVDPFFSFDQGAFDAWCATEGLASFPLADYYTMEFSPGISVPEPGALGILVGLASLARRRR